MDWELLIESMCFSASHAIALLCALMFKPIDIEYSIFSNVSLVTLWICHIVLALIAFSWNPPPLIPSLSQFPFSLLQIINANISTTTEKQKTWYRIDWFQFHSALSELPFTTCEIHWQYLPYAYENILFGSIVLQTTCMTTNCYNIHNETQRM